MPIRTTKVGGEVRGGGRGGGSFTQSESVFLLGRKPHKAKGLALPTDLICQRHLLNKAMSCPRKVSTKPQEKEGPRSRSSPKHMAVNERGHSEAQDGGHPSFSVFLQTVPFHAAPHPPPACQRGRSTRSERSSVTSSQGFRPSSGHYLALPPNMLFRTRGQHGVGAAATVRGSWGERGKMQERESKK